MKKLLIGLFAAVLAVGIIGCAGPNEAPKNEENGNGNQPVTPIGTKVSTEEKEVGDIVFNDGSAMHYTEFAELSKTEQDKKKPYAIALIFYKGKGLNSGSDTETTRTLGVGLIHQTQSFAWCLKDAKARDKEIESIRCAPGGSLGALTFTDETCNDRNGSDNLGQISTFLGKDDDDTGTADNYPAFYFGINYQDVTGSNVKGTKYAAGWYLPSLAEIFQIYACRKDTTNGFDIDTVSESLGGAKFYNVAYWTSTQVAGTNVWAYRFSFDNGNWNNDTKNTAVYKVCCIHEF